MKELFNTRDDNILTNKSNEAFFRDAEFKPFTNMDVEKAISTLKNKATGIDALPARLIKN